MKAAAYSQCCFNCLPAYAPFSSTTGPGAVSGTSKDAGSAARCFNSLGSATFVFAYVYNASAGGYASKSLVQFQ